MSRFVFENEARYYFENLNKLSSTGKITTRLEQYWLCAFLGLVAGKQKKELENSMELIDTFTESLRGHQIPILTLLFYRYVTKVLSSYDSDLILDQMKLFFDDHAPTKLSSDAMDSLNKYAAGGFGILKEKLVNPSDLAIFLINYVDLLGSYLEK